MRSALFEHLKNRENLLVQTSDAIWNLAETKFEELESSETLINLLENEGFTIEREVAGIETAFIASYSFGKADPIIGVLGEYDALSDMSQVGGSDVKESLTRGHNGHGCGHNLLGVGMAGVAIALRHVLEEQRIDGTIRFYGCPAEEGGSGKTYMVRAGCFDDVDIALTWHPDDNNCVSQGSTLANIQAYYRFKGVNSHAAISPHLGRSALDAVELMNMGVNYIREHMIPEARVHYAVTHTGGHSPNVVQADAEVLYLMRAPLVKDVKHMYERINKIAKGAALMTETEVTIEFDKACSNVVPNQTLYTLMHDIFTEIGVPKHTQEELEFAQKMAQTLESDSIADPLVSKLDPLTEQVSPGSVSTDVGDVSWVVPTVQCAVVCYAKGTPFHSWQMVSQGITSLSHKGMLHASKVVAATALQLFINQAMIEEAQKEWQERMKGTMYLSPIPAHIHPPTTKSILNILENTSCT